MSIADPVRVHASRWKLSRLNFGRTLTPLTLLVGIAARRLLWTPLVVVAFALMAVGLWAMLSARRSLGRRWVVVGKGVIHLRLGDKPAAQASDDIPRTQVTSWTWDGATSARLYGPHQSWRLRCSVDDGHTLRALLQQRFGPPYLLRRRGTQRARFSALAAALLGAGSFALGIAYDLFPLFALGTLGVVLGGAAFGAFSQRVVR